MAQSSEIPVGSASEERQITPGAPAPPAAEARGHADLFGLSHDGLGLPPDPVSRPAPHAAAPVPSSSTSTGEAVIVGLSTDPGPPPWFAVGDTAASTPAEQPPASHSISVEPIFVPPGNVDPARNSDRGRSRATSRQGPPSASWLTVLVAAYASALTLASFWLWLTGRLHLHPEPRRAAALPHTEESAAPLAVTATRSLGADHLVDLGSTGRFGQLEVSPLAVSHQSIRLRSQVDPESNRRADNVLVLRLRLRNLDPNSTISPLERASVRSSDQAPSEAVIENGLERIDAYPLSAQSEWELEGQSFPVLEPGEEAETILVSRPLDTLPGNSQLVWRLRLRTGQSQTELVGVRFRPGDARIETQPR